MNKKLYEATRRRAQTPKQEQYRWECEQLHDYVLFMANTGLRPDEAMRLEYRDVQIVRDAATNETILEIEVRGKRGVGHCKSMTGAVVPFKRLKKRNNPELTERLFPKNQRDLLNTILRKEGLKVDRDGDLVNVGTFHQPKANVGVPQAVRGSLITVAEPASK
jgi:integrase